MAGGFDSENQLEEYKAKCAALAARREEVRAEGGAMWKNYYLQPYMRMWPNEDEMDDIKKRFLKQIRESSGYDLDCLPRNTQTQFHPYKKHELFDDQIQERARDGLKIINEQLKPSGERYKLVRIMRAVHVAHLFTLFTLRVKDVEDSSLQTLRVCVVVPRPFDKCEFGVEEWKLLPSDGNEQKEEEEVERQESEERKKAERLRMKAEVERLRKKAELLGKKAERLRKKSEEQKEEAEAEGQEPEERKKAECLREKAELLGKKAECLRKKSELLGKKAECLRKKAELLGKKAEHLRKKANRARKAEKRAITSCASGVSSLVIFENGNKQKEEDEADKAGGV